MGGIGGAVRRAASWIAVVAALVATSGCGSDSTTPPAEIAYSSRQEGRQTVWIIDEFGNNAREVTPGFTFATDPSFSPDGDRLYFVSDDTGHFEVYVADLGSGDITRLTFDERRARHPSASPDGGSIVFLSDRQGASPDVWLMGIDGSSPRRVTDWEGHKSKPQFSPDGTWIAVQADRPDKQIYLVRPDGTEARNISDNSFGDRYPTWSPDGLQLAFTSVRNVAPDGTNDEVREIYLMAVDGSGQRPLIGDGVDSRHAHWSPDGRIIAFDRAADGSRHIFVAHPDGTGLRQVTTTGSNHKPAVRPTNG